MNSGKVVLGLLAGVAAGALAGILLAPEKGSETRKSLLKKGEDYKGKVKDKFNNLYETANQKFDKVKEDVSNFAEKKMDKTEYVG
jgi:gas vesicle protein